MTDPTDRDRSVVPLPERPNLRFLKDQAKAMVKAGRAPTLTLAQYALAQQHGFSSWPKLKRHVEALTTERGESATARLIAAAARGDLAEVKKQVRAGADLKHEYDLARGYGSFAPPLKAAVENGHTDCVRYLLQRGALDRVWHWDGLEDARRRGHDAIVQLLTEHRGAQDTLIEAIRAGAHGRVEELLQADPTLALANEAGHGPLLPPLLLAADRGDLRMVQLLLDAGADPATDHHASSFNALTHAIYHGHADIIDLLQQHGVVSDDVINYLFAAGRGDLDRVKHYLGQGVDVNAKCPCEHHVIPHAFGSGNEALLQYVLQQGADIARSNGWAGYVWWLGYIERGDVEAVRRILDMGYDVNYHDEQGDSPLAMARRFKQPQIEALLQARGASLASRTELLANVRGGQLERVKQQLRHADVRERVLARDKHGDCLFGTWATWDAFELVDALEPYGIPWTPQLAAMWGRLDVLRELVARDRSALTDRHERYRTPMHAALRFGRIEVAAWLIEQGVDLPATDDGYVRWATFGRHPEAIRFAAQHGAAVDQRDEHGGTALYHEAKHGWHKLVPLLLELGADPSLVNSVTGLSPLQVAERSRRGNKLVEMLRQPREGEDRPA